MFLIGLWVSNIWFKGILMYFLFYSCKIFIRNLRTTQFPESAQNQIWTKKPRRQTASFQDFIQSKPKHFTWSFLITLPFLGKYHNLFSLGRRCSRNTGNSSSSRSEISVCWHLSDATDCTVVRQWSSTCLHIKYEAHKTQHVWFLPFSLLTILYVIISLSDSKLLLNVAGLPFLQKWFWQGALGHTWQT